VSGSHRRSVGAPNEPPPPHGLARRAWHRDEAVEFLEAPDRRESQDPEVLFDRVHLAVGESVVDVGAGTGYFAVVAARRVGPRGIVHAVDLSEELVELLAERAARESLPQLVPLRSSAAEIPLPDSVADLVLLANVLHDVPDSTVAEAVRTLRPDGRLVNVDWRKVRGTPRGPPIDIRLTPRAAEARLGRHGLVAVDRFRFGPWHYGIVMRHRPTPHGPPRLRGRRSA